MVSATRSRAHDVGAAPPALFNGTVILSGPRSPSAGNHQAPINARQHTTYQRQDRPQSRVGDSTLHVLVPSPGRRLRKSPRAPDGVTVVGRLEDGDLCRAPRALRQRRMFVVDTT